MYGLGLTNFFFTVNQRCVCFDISTLHREDAKIVMTCLGSLPNCVVNGGANILSVALFVLIILCSPVQISSVGHVPDFSVIGAHTG